MAYSTDADSAPVGVPAKTSKKKRKENEARVKSMIHDSMRFHESELSRFRIKAGKYYRGEPFGDEEEGRSKIVLTEVRDAVLQQMPPLMRVFFGPDGAVEFVARRPDAVDLAEQQTDYINHIFAEENPGFFVLHAAFKDALVRRIGIVKWWWEERDVIESERLSGLEEGELEALLTKEPDLEIEQDSLETAEDGTQTVIVRRKIKRGQCRVAAVPPEEFIYNRSARSVEEAVFVAHVTSKRAGDLMAMGYSKKEVDAVSPHSLLVPSIERESRRPRGASLTEMDESNIGENREISYVEAYVRMDFGEGIEQKKMCFLGAELNLVHTEPAPDRPFAVFTPDPEPHEIQGLSTMDMAGDLQLIDSHIARGILNSLNLSLHPRSIFNQNMVNVKDLMNVEIGAMVRSDGDPNIAVKELVHTFVGAEGLGVLDFFKGIKEERLGVTRASAGLNPDALQSSSQQAVEATTSKAEARTELMARIFAEGMKGLFRGLYNMVRRNQQKPLLVRLRGQYVQVDPSIWPSDPDVTVRVGIGGGTKQDKLAFISATVEKQEAVMQQLGPNNMLTDLRRYRGSLAEGAKLMGFDPNRAWKDVTDEQIQEMEEASKNQPPPTDPAQMLAEAQVQNEGVKLQNDQMKMQADQEYKMAQLELQREELELKKAEMEFRAKELELSHQLDLEKVTVENTLKREEMTLKYQTELSAAQVNSEVEIRKAQIMAESQVTMAAQKDRARKLTIARDASGGIAGATEEMQ